MIHARENYVPKPYPGRVTYFQATNHSQRYYHDPWLDRESLVAAGFIGSYDSEDTLNEFTALGWGALARGGMEVVPVPGWHAFIVREPHVKILAEKLRMSIDKAWSQYRTQSDVADLKAGREAMLPTK